MIVRKRAAAINPESARTDSGLIANGVTDLLGRLGGREAATKHMRHGLRESRDGDR